MALRCLIGGIALVVAAGSVGSAAGPSSEYFEADGVRLHYLRAGKGPTVVLLHGLRSSAELNWKMPGIIDELARDHQVVALDLPGHGRSDAPEKASAYGRQVVNDVLLLLDHLHVERAHIVGYSLGGMVTLRLIADHPDRVLSGTLGGMGWLQDGSRLERFWERLGSRGGVRTGQAFLAGVPEFALTEQDVTAIKRPVTIVIGDRDPCRRMYVVPLERIRPDWPVVHVPDAGHFNCIVQPEFQAALAAWVRSHD